MKIDVPIEQLLRWRLAHAESEAPVPPRAARLLEAVRPWWEVLPERFEQLVQRLATIQVAYGHAMAEPVQAGSDRDHRVAVLVVRGTEELECSARILYFAIRDGQLRLRFELQRAPGDMPPWVEVTFVSEGSGRPLFSAPASVSVEKEYRLEAELPAELAEVWDRLKVTDRMPFRFIIRADTNG